jgi:hypothetical protein
MKKTGNLAVIDISRPVDPLLKHNFLHALHVRKKYPNIIYQINIK